MIAAGEELDLGRLGDLVVGRARDSGQGGDEDQVGGKGKAQGPPVQTAQAAEKR